VGLRLLTIGQAISTTVAQTTLANGEFAESCVNKRNFAEWRLSDGITKPWMPCKVRVVTIRRRVESHDPLCETAAPACVSTGSSTPNLTNRLKFIAITSDLLITHGDSETRKSGFYIYGEHRG
jgi:hypothetical protein